MNILSWLINLFNKNKKIVSEKPESFGGSLSEMSTGDTSEVTTEIATANVLIELNKIKSEFENDFAEAKREFEKLDEKWNRISNFLMVLTTFMASVFVVTSLLIALDYFKYNHDRYEKIMNETKIIQKEFKDCIWNNGLYRCLR